MSRLHCITPWQGRKPSVLSEEQLTPREEKPCGFVHHFCEAKMVEGIFILQNSSLKLKSVADNAILQNYAVSSENISKRIKQKQRTAFTSKLMSVFSDEIKIRPEKQSHRRQLFCNKKGGKFLPPEKHIVSIR